MENLLNQIEVAVSYHAKSKVSKYDILLGDDQLLGLIIENLRKEYEYQTLRDNVQSIIDEKLSELTPRDYEVYQCELVSSDSVDSKIDNAIVEVLNLIENKFVRSELIRMAVAPKKMLRAKMFLKVNAKNDYKAAALIELFHLATLIQDDVIDVASTRRYTQTINSKYDDQTAILISDYLLVHIGYMIGENGKDEKSTVKSTDKDVQTYYEELIKDFLKSLLYSEKEVTKVIDNKSYDNYASNKTAKFFKVALISGVMSSNLELSLDMLEEAGEFGLKFGLIFQKVDDMLDYIADVDLSGKDSRDAENNVNNYILLNLKIADMCQVKKNLSNEINDLLESDYGQVFNDEINYLIRRINE